MTRLDALLARAAGDDVCLPDTDELDYTTPVPDEGPLDASIVVLGESLGPEEVLQRRNFCLEALTPVLMADMTWKFLGDVCVGDEICTVEENPPFISEHPGVTSQAARRWVRATVTAKYVKQAPCLRIITEDGELVGTPDHRVLAKPKATIPGGVWVRLDGLNTKRENTRHGEGNGTKIAHVGVPWVALQTYDAGWLAGLFDGEGSVEGSKGGKGNGTACFSQNQGLIVNKVHMLLKDLGFKIRAPEEQKQYTSNIMVRTYIAGGLFETMRFLGTVRPVRLLQEFQSVLFRRAFHTRSVVGAEVVARFPWGTHTVVDIQTTAGTFIANGFVVHNCGKSGQKLRTHMRLAGIHPEKCRILNVYPFYPEGGSIEKLDPGVLRQWQANTMERLRACRQATVIVCVGNVALETCTGFRDITRRRGSVYAWEGKKVVGMIRPAAILHSRGRGGGQYFEKMCRLDWERVKLLSTPHETHHAYCGCAKRVQRYHILPPTVGDTRAPKTYGDSIPRYIRMSHNPQKVLALDIETPKVAGKRQIMCVSFAFSPEESLVLPWPECKSIVQALCESSCTKVGHNIVSFDRWWLAREGITLGGELRDTMCVHHCLDPASPQSLEFLTSRYTWEPWYKDEGKGHDITLIEKDVEGYYAYCGLDSAVTIEIHNLLWPELERQGLLDFYRKHYEALYDPIFDVMLQGVSIDHPYRVQVLEELLREAHACRDRLGEINGKPLWSLNTQRDQTIYDALTAGIGHISHEGIAAAQWLKDAFEPLDIEIALERIGKKTVSNAQLKTLLYDKLGLPLQTRRRKGSVETPTADAVALRRLRLQYAEKPDVVEVLDTAMRHNKVQKLATFLYPNTFDPTDGRFRFTLKLNTEAARLASAAAPDGMGRNSQNTPRDDKRIRRVILPDLKHVIVEADCSQIEGRIVFVRTKDPELIRLGRARIGFDQHAFTASMVFKKPVEQVGKGTQERQVAKSISHAAQRAMQGKTMADWMMKNNMVHEDMTPYDADECDVLLDSYYKAFPGILLWQQRIRREVRAKKRLVNRWGRIWDVQYEELNDDLYRKAYNFLPQSECADLTNQCFAALYKWLKAEQMSSRILMQEHDSLVNSCSPAEAYDVACFMRDHLEVELDYDGVSLSVPVEFKVGKNWGDCVEIGALPDRAAFEKIVRQL